MRMDIYATLKSNMEKKVPTIGFIDHMDTSPDAEGRCINPQTIIYKDGARLSYMGLPTPNIFTGGYNFHGRFEFITTESMILASRTILKIIENNNK